MKTKMKACYNCRHRLARKFTDRSEKNDPYTFVLVLCKLKKPTRNDKALGLEYGQAGTKVASYNYNCPDHKKIWWKRWLYI